MNHLVLIAVLLAVFTPGASFAAPQTVVGVGIGVTIRRDTIRVRLPQPALGPGDRAPGRPEQRRDGGVNDLTLVTQLTTAYTVTYE